MEPCTKKAPAKLNLYLHITGKRPDGYHLLDSLVAFTEFGDEIILAPADELSLSIHGPFAATLDAKNNLVMRAVQAFSGYTAISPTLHITLIKNIPVEAGLGGGSADAAATLNALNELYDTKLSVSELSSLALPLGADLPMCLTSSSAYMSGIGEILQPVSLPPLHVLLINPNKPCPTANIFPHVTPPFREPPLKNQEAFHDPHQFYDFLQHQDNQLTAPAIKLVPDISIILNVLKTQNGCALARMSGSGATCFGLFYDEVTATTAHRAISQKYPHYWSCVTNIKS